MDESQSLDNLSNLLAQLIENPYDISLHAQHIRLVRSNDGLQTQLIPALEMFSNYFAAGEDVWMPLLDARQSNLDLNSATEETLTGMLQLYDRAEHDYLSIPILRRHLEFLVEAHAHFAEEGGRQDIGELFSTDWTSSAIERVVKMGIGHLTESHLLWDIQRDWEMSILEAAPDSEKALLVPRVENLHFARLQQPHSNHEGTLQSYSSFTTSHKPPKEYESLLVAASKLRRQVVKSYERREPLETALAQSKYSLEAYAHYIATERRPKQPDLLVLKTLYERAIAEAAKRRLAGENGAEEALRAFWIGYLDFMRGQETTWESKLTNVRRAVRSVPGSGEVWSRHLRLLEQLERLDPPPVELEAISDVFDGAMAKNLIQKDIEQVVPIVLARAGYEMRSIGLGRSAEDAFASLVTVLEDGIRLVQSATPNGDPRLRLEKYLAELYLRLDLEDIAISLWQATAKHYKTSYLAWVSYTDVLIKQGRHDQARVLFKDLTNKNLDWPEAIWEAWLAFEHLNGDVQDIDVCLERIERAWLAVNTKRAKEAEAYQAAQMAVDQRVPNEVLEVPNDDVIMQDSKDGFGEKRKLEGDKAEEAHKKAKTEEKTTPLKRDRENSTVFVGDLARGVTEEELLNLFKDCGEVREVKITQLSDALVATVEFLERQSIPAALTKDKKRLRGSEIAVHLVWKSTLYVTNFPEAADDASVRQLFGQYGTLFEVRWPSKKFKDTRRFCYVQFTSPSSAEKALELHGRELQPGMPLSVLISNPERKKERTDARANEREIYVAGLNKFTTQEDLQKLFSTYGSVKEVRMATDNGHSKGFAFVEFLTEGDAVSALAANNHELKGRRIAVTLADTRVRAKNRNVASGTGLSRLAETRNRSIRVRNLPASVQEGLLQQAFEKYALVRRVEVFHGRNEAVVELENPAEAGKLLLQASPIILMGHALELAEGGSEGRFKSRPAAPPTTTRGMLVPRTAISRPRAGLGHSRKPVDISTSFESSDAAKAKLIPKGQDEFRKMLG